MFRALTTAATGMEAQQIKLDVNSNNIANVSTNGFKKSRAEFSDLMYQTLRTPGAPTGPETRSPTGLQVGLGVRAEDTQRMHSEGDLRQTGNPLDVAIEGRGFLAVTRADGTTGYTRNGSLKLNAEGRLVTGSGDPLASEVTIPPDAQRVDIARDGTVSVVQQGQALPTEVGKIELATFANPAGLEAKGNNIFGETASSGTPVIGAAGENGAGTLSQGTLEMSNVSVVQEMIDLISGQRAYEVNSRVIRAASTMLRRTVDLIR